MMRHAIHLVAALLVVVAGLAFAGAMTADASRPDLSGPTAAAVRANGLRLFAPGTPVEEVARDLLDRGYHCVRPSRVLDNVTAVAIDCTDATRTMTVSVVTRNAVLADVEVQRLGSDLVATVVTPLDQGVDELDPALQARRHAPALARWNATVAQVMREAEAEVAARRPRSAPPAP